MEVESNILVVDRLRNTADRSMSRKRHEASSSSSSPLPLQTNETTKIIKSLFARMERWELEGKPLYRNPQNTDSRVFRKPNNNVPQDFPREQRSGDRDDQRIQTPLQNNLVSHEEGRRWMNSTLRSTASRTLPRFLI